MGCASSKQARRDSSSHRRRRPLQQQPPLSRCSSMPIQHHHVSLTSSTLGTLNINPSHKEEESETNNAHDLSSEVRKARTWSDMIEKQRVFPRTPTKTPPNEPEVIDMWELMEGLDVTPLYFPKSKTNPDDRRSFSFDSSITTLRWTPAPPPPPWLHNKKTRGDEPIIAEFDPEIISTFRKALEQLSPEHQFVLRASPEPKGGIVKSMVSVFQEKIDEANKKKREENPNGCSVVLYYTSLRGVRRTYEECCQVRTILRGYGVRVDERDVSMDSGYKEELHGLVGEARRGLPAVFVRGEWVGGAEEVRGMHESGELEKVLGECERVVMEGGEVVVGGGACEGCGDVRFVNCNTCYGSCKVFVEEEEEVVVVEGGVFQRCPDCNENGLVRCPVCSC
ncbi:Uncharacterized protein QJS10_CPA09g00612 [Acorus calamus]|uniref:Glutaredoxin domain-containing protein n=1 Tax=Acorus calamus TaxID=4465 RepID=A0AAV9EBU5_ACOCL|nr:Uncharacterized protein QJS10_CPA09g00612 [Acorus calamus]